uniref:AntA/AntB antirepressor n=1 Tax=Siphoviridae sp. ct0Go27 TaxID=2827761 RepID=A0A8S5RWJ2_9CAUD|nr:MAG TPA: AntA/AntB antirepressor [Siphoviridae sp. ct0Go27]
MNELITITTNEVGEPTVLGRELHEFLGVTTRYNDWFPRMTEYGRKRLTKDFQRNPPEDGRRKQGLSTGLWGRVQKESGRIRKGR